jgi:hypothetical protein
MTIGKEKFRKATEDEFDEVCKKIAQEVELPWALLIITRNQDNMLLSS